MCQYQALLEEFLVRIGRCFAPQVVHRGCASLYPRLSIKKPVHKALVSRIQEPALPKCRFFNAQLAVDKNGG